MRHPLRPVFIAAIVLGLFAAALGVRAYQQPRNDFHVALLGDRTGSAQPQIYGRVWREIELLHPDFVLNVGDTIQGSKSDETVEAQWAEFHSQVWKRYKHFPMYFTPGNHDIWSPFSEQIYVRETKYKTHYSFDYQDAHFTVLDNSRSSDLDETQLKFLEDDLKANRERNPKFIVFHKPFWIGAIDRLGSEFPLHRIAKQYGVAHVVSGHVHRFVRRERDGIAYMEVGSSGGGMKAPLERGEGFAQGIFHHFVWVKVDGAKVSMAVKEIDGAKGSGRMFRAEDWDEKGPKFNIADPAASWNPET
jgi:UDP-2,3-diacylglucosamine pyrophosphatase LpxH